MKKKSWIIAGAAVLAAGLAAAGLVGCSNSDYHFEEYTYNHGGTSEKDWRALEYPDENIELDGLVNTSEYGEGHLDFSDVNDVNMKVYAHMGEEGVFFGFVSDDEHVNYNPSHDVFNNTSVEIQVAPYGTERLNSNVVQLRLGANGTPDQWVGFRSGDGYSYSKKYIPSMGAVHVNGTLNGDTEGYSVELYLPYTSIGLEGKPKEGKVVCAPSFNTLANPMNEQRSTWTMMLGCDLNAPATWYVVDENGMQTHTAGFTTSSKAIEQEGEGNEFYYFDHTPQKAYYLKSTVELLPNGNAFLGGDNYPKFGLVNKSVKELQSFHIDAANRNGTNFGTVHAEITTKDATNWMWNSNASTSMGGHWGSTAIGGYGSIKMETIYYQGDLYFVLDGTLVKTVHGFAAAEGAVPGFMCFNTMATFKNNEYETDAAKVKTEVEKFTAKDVKIDGDLSDWKNDEVNRHFKFTDDPNGNSMKVRAFYGTDGLYMAYEVHHLVNPPAAKWDEDPSLARSGWWQNTNIEFFINGSEEKDHYALTSFGTSGYMDAVMITVRDENREYDTVGEIFVPFASLTRDGFKAGDPVAVGFAFKPSGDTSAENLLGGTNWWSFDGSPRENHLPVVAKGIGAEYQITFDAGEGGSGTMEPLTVFCGDTVELPACTFTRDGYRLLSWYDGEHRYRAGATYTMPEEGVTMTAIWISNDATGTYHVTYAKGEGEVTGEVPVDDAEYAPGEEFPVAEKGDLAREGYRFMGWSDGETTYEAGGTGDIGEEDITLTAVWAKEYTLTYSLGEAEGTPPEGRKYIEGESVVVTTEVPERTGFDLVGWDYNDRVYGGGEKFEMPAENVTLTAHWGAHLTVNGRVDDWKTLNSKTLSAHSYSDGRKATWYGVLRSDGIYLAVEYYHNNDPKFGQTNWWDNTNFEIHFANAQFYVYLKDAISIDTPTMGSNNGTDFSGATAKFTNNSGGDAAKYCSVFEVFYPNAIIDQYRQNGVVRIGLAVKSAGGDESINGGGVGFEGDAWYTPYGVWPDDPNMFAYLTGDGLVLNEEYEHPGWKFGAESAAKDDNSITVDGSLSDWGELHTLGIKGTDLYDGKSVTFYGKLTDKGLYLAAEAYHEKFTTNGGIWYDNTNLELRIGRNWGGEGNKMPRQFWVNATADGCAVSAEGMQAKLVHEKVEGHNQATEHTIIEVFIPNEVFLEYDYMIRNGMIQVGVAWKTNNDGINNAQLGDGDAWWMPKGEHINNNPACVDGTGIYTSGEYAAKQD